MKIKINYTTKITGFDLILAEADWKRDLAESSSTKTLKFRDYPTSTQRTNGPYAVTTSTTKIDTRARGRQGALRVESSATGDAWRFGTYRAEVRPDGRR